MRVSVFQYPSNYMRPSRVGTEAVPLDESEGLVRLLIKVHSEKQSVSDLISQPVFARHVDYSEAHGCLKAKEINNRPVTTPTVPSPPLTMKVTSLLSTLGLGALALAHSSPETRTNVKDVSAQSAWDSTIGKGAPALVELCVS